MATYVVSDIHGFYNTFLKLLDNIDFDMEKDTLYILGDLIDRGPHSAEMLEWAMNAPENVHCLLGNHEDMAIPVLRDSLDDLIEPSMIWYNEPWSWNGGRETFSALWEKFGADGIAFRVLPWLKSLPLYFTIGINGKDILLVHAGIAINGARMSDDYISSGRQDFIDIPRVGENWAQSLLWIRENWLYSNTPIPYDYVIFGHTRCNSGLMRDYVFWSKEDTDKCRKAVNNGKDTFVHIIGFDPAANGKVVEKIDIDTGYGSLGALRLDDMREFYVSAEEEAKELGS